MLIVETIFARQARLISLSDKQKSLIVGSLLGDEHLGLTTAGYCFRVNHGLQQRDYVNWKYEILKDFVRTPPKQCGGTYHFRTITHPAITAYRNFFYCGKQKRIDLGLLQKEFTPFSFAVWLMDDGAIDGRQIRINSQSFSQEDNDLLARFLRAKFGIKATVQKDRKYFRLCITQASMKLLNVLVRSYFIPDMLYKLPL